MFVGFDHVARRIVNGNHGIMRAALELRVIDSNADFGIRQRDL